MRSFATPMKVWIAVLVAALAVSALIPSTGSGQSRSVTRTVSAQSSRDGVVVQVPAGWKLTDGRINNVIDPVTVFTVSTFSIPKVTHSSRAIAPWRCSRSGAQTGHTCS